MVTRPVYKKKKLKEVPSKKMKHNSPLQKHVFPPPPPKCRILKRNHIFSPLFVIIDKGYKSYKTSPEKHKDD